MANQIFILIGNAKSSTNYETIMFKHLIPIL